MDENNTDILAVTVDGTSVDIVGDEPVALTPNTTISFTPTDAVDGGVFQLMDLSVKVEGATSATVILVYENGTEKSMVVSQLLFF